VPYELVLPQARVSLFILLARSIFSYYWEDATVGSFLGLVLSFFAYRQNHPPVKSDEPTLPSAKEAAR